MELWEKFYVATYLSVSLLGAVVLFLERETIALFQMSYWRFLFQPWKVLTFLISGTVVTFLGRYTDDPTWDWVDGGFMSILAFLTAPWATGTIYRALVRRERLRIAFSAACIWMFSVSWSYDLYLLWRDAIYPPTWLANMAVSSLLYLCAGLFWSLGWQPDKGAVFTFTDPVWPRESASVQFRKVIWVGFPFMLLAAWMILIYLKRSGS